MATAKPRAKRTTYHHTSTSTQLTLLIEILLTVKKCPPAIYNIIPQVTISGEKVMELLLGVNRPDISLLVPVNLMVSCPNVRAHAPNLLVCFRYR